MLHFQLQSPLTRHGTSEKANIIFDRWRGTYRAKIRNPVCDNVGSPGFNENLVPADVAPVFGLHVQHSVIVTKK